MEKQCVCVSVSVREREKKERVCESVRGTG